MHSSEEKNTPSTTETGNPQKTNWKKELVEWIACILIAVVLAFVIRENVFTLVKVQGASMEPTLSNSDRLYVNRFFYQPEKGDVIIFKPSSANHPYVKRIIATEGDSIYIDFSTGDIYVNDVLIQESYIKEKTKRKGLYISNQEKTVGYSRENPIVIKPDHYFVLGDNRNNSEDSRELGQIPRKEIMGGAVFRFWPLNAIGSVHEDAQS